MSVWGQSFSSRGTLASWETEALVLGSSLNDKCETEVLTYGVLVIATRMEVQTSVVPKVTLGPQLLPQLFTVQTTGGLTFGHLSWTGLQNPKSDQEFDNICLGDQCVVLCLVLIIHSQDKITIVAPFYNYHRVSAVIVADIYVDIL